MFNDSRNEYSVKTCPTEDPEKLENMLNQMSAEGWELYMLHESESRSGGLQYNCIFYREYEEDAEEAEIVEVNDFKTRMEKMLTGEPHEECREIQGRINQKHKKIAEIKNQLDSSSNDINRKKLNEEMSKTLKALNELKNKLSDVINPDLMYERINQDKLTIVVSEELIDLVNSEKNGDLITETVKLRQNLAEELGYVIPAIKFTNSETLDANEFRIDVRELKVLSGFVYPGYVRFNPEETNIGRRPKGSIEDTDPVSGQKILWIEENKTKNFWEQGLSSAQVITQHLEYIACKYADEILDYSSINHYLQIAGTENLFLIENLIPDFLSLGDLRYILANLIREKVSIRDIIFIFEKLNDLVPKSPIKIDKNTEEYEYIIMDGTENSVNKDEIIEKLRIALKRQICANIADINGNIYGIFISDKFASSLEKELNKANITTQNLLKSQKLNKFIGQIVEIVKNSDIDVLNMAVIVPTSIRRKLFNILESTIFGLSVISNAEISDGFNIEMIENII